MSRTRVADMTPHERLSRIGWDVTESGCWEWKGARYGKSDYGEIRMGEKMYAHRLAYATWVGPIPDGMAVRHEVCDNPPCINPEHLALGTQADNMADMVSHGRSLTGDKNPRAKLTNEQAEEIRQEWARDSSRGRGRALAAKYGVSVALISTIVNRKVRA